MSTEPEGVRFAQILIEPAYRKQFLADHSNGLIGLSACLKGEVAENLMSQKYEQAKAAAGQFREIFGAKNFSSSVILY